MPRIIRMLFVQARLMFNARALREIDPMHPDLPGLLIETRELQETWRQLTVEWR